jgi:hypothetical protein
MKLRSLTSASLAATCIAPFLAFSVAIAQPAQQSSTGYQPKVGQEGKDVVWVPSPQALVDRMLDMASVTKDDFVIDLGSGDGRTVITAAKRGARSLGIEYNPDLVVLSKENAKKEGVTNAEFVRGDIFETDFTQATVLTLFLLPQLNLKLRPTILDMKPGTRVVSNTFNMAEWEPDQTIEAGGDCTSYCRAFFWVVPAKVAGTWKMPQGELKLDQSFQKLSGTLTVDGKAMPISDAKMTGAQITFTAGGKTYTGRVDGNTMSGTSDGGWTATRS